jgi:hypothetical protein
LIGAAGETSVDLDVSKTGEWVSIDIPLTSYSTVDLSDVFQFKVDGNGDVMFDNLYFGGLIVSGCTSSAATNYNAAANTDDGSCVYPTTPSSPVPTEDAATVLSIFSDAYTNVSGTDFNPNWGQATVVTIDSVLSYSSLSYQGTQFADQDVSVYTHLNVDYYVTESTALNFFLIGGGETSVPLDVTSKGVWISKQIPLSYFTAVDLTKVIQFKVDGNGDVLFDNLYFGGADPVRSGCTNPDASNYDSSANSDDGSCIVVTVPASPVPTLGADSVLSIFSDAYTDLEGTDFNPGWGQATQVAVTDVLKYSNLNYQGTVFSTQDVSEYDFVHLDYYTDDNAASLKFFLVSIVDGETNERYETLSTANKGEWNSVDIPLTEFTHFYWDNVDLSAVSQIKMEGSATMYIDNIYFGKSSTVEGCTVAYATNYSEEANTDDGSCLIEGCVDTLAVNHWDAEANVDDGSCEYSQAYVDSVIAAATGGTPVDSTSIADAAYALGAASVTPEDGVSQADVDAAVAAVDITTDNAAAYADGAASVTPEDGVSQADVDAAVAAVDITTDNAAAYADGAASVTPEDGVSQADVDAVQAQLDAALANGGGSCDPIYVDIVAGWNILGYTLSYGQDVAATVADIVDDIEIVKNNDAKVYWPEFGFNGIGDFVPGQGYQIKTKAAISNYTWPDVSNARVEMTPTVPTWAFEMEAELHPNDIRSLVKVVNMLGQEVNAKDQFSGEVLLHLYNDGTVEKKIVK